MKTHFERTIKRTEQKEAGAFDGRYKPKVIPNKKKKAQKNWARKNKQYELLSNGCIRTTLKKRKYENANYKKSNKTDYRI